MKNNQKTMYTLQHIFSEQWRTFMKLFQEIYHGVSGSYPSCRIFAALETYDSFAWLPSPRLNRLCNKAGTLS